MSGSLEGQAYHLVGIGGAGMSAVARLLAAAGANVSGSDRSPSKTLNQLREEGIDAFSPHGAQDFPEGATVVVSSAIRPDNVELVRAEERAQQVIHRSQALALAAGDLDFIAVAGAHGKTTSSAMLAATLLSAGLDPAFAIGGTVLGVGGGARTGSSVFVAEADESDGSFLNYSPTIALVTNVEPDHLDHFGSQEAFEGAFRAFVDRIVPGGYLVACAEDPGAARLAEYGRRVLGEQKVVTYGRKTHSAHTPDVEIAAVDLSADGAAFQLTKDGQKQTVHLDVTGEHNVLNAAGAWSVATLLGVSGQQAADGLAEFRGAGRRFELRTEVAGRRLFDDYAHHPTELHAALQQARLVAGAGRVIIVFQPHLYSRTQNFLPDFVAALNLADEVVVSDIFAAREDPIPGVDAALVANHPQARVPFHLGGSGEDAARLGASMTGHGDICLLVGAGDINTHGPVVEGAWRNQS